MADAPTVPDLGARVALIRGSQLTYTTVERHTPTMVVLADGTRFRKDSISGGAFRVRHADRWSPSTLVYPPDHPVILRARARHAYESAVSRANDLAESVKTALRETRATPADVDKARSFAANLGLAIERVATAKQDMNRLYKEASNGEA